MRRAAITVLLAVLLVALFAWQSTSQPSQGFGPVYDATNQALRVNTVAGGAAGGTSSNFNQAMPGPGTAAGFRNAAGLMASASITNNNALLVEQYGNVTDTGLNAVRVNLVAGGGSGGTSSNYGTAFPTAGTAVGFKDPLGAMASATVDNTGRQIVTFATPVTLNASTIVNVRTTSDSTLTATVTQSGTWTVAAGASASVANTWSTNVLTDTGLPVRPGDDTNKAVRVNVVAGSAGGTSSNFGTAFPTAGTAIGVRAGNGSMASASVTNTSALLVTLRNTDGSEVPIAQDGTFNAAVGTTGPLVGFRTAGGLQASASITNNNGLLVEHYGNVTDTANNALRVNLVAGGGTGGTNSNFGTAWPTAGTAAGFKDPLGAMASATVDNTGRQIVTFATPVTINGTVNTAPASFSFINLAKVNGDTVNVGTGAAAVGTMRVAVSTDSTLTSVGTITNAVSVASFSFVNVAKINNDPVNVGLGSAGAGTLRVAVASDSQGNAGANQAAPTRVSYIGGRGGADAQAFLRCDQFASISTANTGNWQLVASASGQNVYVCGYTFVAGVTPVAIKFVGGQTATDKPCSDDSMDLTGAMSVAASGGVVNSTSPVPQFWTNPSHGLCVNLSNGAQVSGHVTYTRF